MTVGERDLNEEEGWMGQTGNRFGQVVFNDCDSDNGPSEREIKERANRRERPLTIRDGNRRTGEELKSRMERSITNRSLTFQEFVRKAVIPHQLSLLTRPD